MNIISFIGAGVIGKGFTREVSGLGFSSYFSKDTRGSLNAI